MESYCTNILGRKANFNNDPSWIKTLQKENYSNVIQDENSSITNAIKKCLEDFEKKADFYKSFYPFFSKSLHIHFNPSQNVSTVLLLNGLVMVTNEETIACKCFKKGNVRGYSL